MSDLTSDKPVLFVKAIDEFPPKIVVLNKPTTVAAVRAKFGER
ncbi:MULTISPECIES: hypothetical protein [Lactobacillaceae]|nr:hypothetical protein [Lactobacillus sp. HBUAS51381]